MQQATAKAAHLVTWTTKAVVSEWSLGYLASLLALSSYFEEKDPDYNSNRVLSQSQHLDASARDREIVYSTKLSLVLKAVIGWYYLRPQACRERGMAWFKFMVIRAHDLIVKDCRYQPSILPSDTVATVRRSVDC